MNAERGWTRCLGRSGPLGTNEFEATLDELVLPLLQLELAEEPVERLAVDERDLHENRDRRGAAVHVIVDGRETHTRTVRELLGLAGHEHLDALCHELGIEHEFLLLHAFLLLDVRMTTYKHPCAKRIISQ